MGGNFEEIFSTLQKIQNKNKINLLIGMAESSLDNPKLFAALLNGVFKRLFENDESITPEVLFTEVFSENVPIEGIFAVLFKYQKKKEKFIMKNNFKKQ